jgi:hypothetical protein
MLDLRFPLAAMDTTLDTKLDMIWPDKNNPRSGMGVARVCPIVYHLIPRPRA